MCVSHLTEIIPAVIRDPDVSGPGWYHGHLGVSERPAWHTETRPLEVMNPNTRFKGKVWDTEMLEMFFGVNELAVGLKMLETSDCNVALPSLRVNLCQAH